MGWSPRNCTGGGETFADRITQNLQVLGLLRGYCSHHHDTVGGLRQAVVNSSMEYLWTATLTPRCNLPSKTSGATLFWL